VAPEGPADTGRDTYAIVVRTESGQTSSHPTPAEFRQILLSLGASGDSWLIAEPVPGERGGFFQVLRESATRYRTEIRDPSAQQHVAALVSAAEAVDDLMAAWVRGSRTWLSAQDWVPADELDSAVQPEPEIAAEAADRARELIAGGYLSQYRAAKALVENFCDLDGNLGLVHSQAKRIVAAAWRERLAEQETWPERTDADAVEEAFAALEAQNIVARADFTDCANCGHSEIGAELGPDSLGYVFFHQQSTKGVVQDGQLWLYFGACGPDREQDAVVGRKIADALTAAALPVRWNGDGNTAIAVGPITWRKRLPAAPPPSG
jgi:hypothetical protein